MATIKTGLDRPFGYYGNVFPAGTIGPIRVTEASDPTDVAKENQTAQQDTQTVKKPRLSEKARRRPAWHDRGVKRVKPVYASEVLVYFFPLSGQTKASE